MKENLKMAALCALGFLGAVTLGEAAEVQSVALKVWMCAGALCEWMMAGVLFRKWRI